MFEGVVDTLLFIANTVCGQYHFSYFIPKYYYRIVLGPFLL